MLLQSRSKLHQNHGVMEPENKGAAITVSISDYNTYSKLISSFITNFGAV